MNITIEGRRSRGRTKKQWKDCVRKDMDYLQVAPEVAVDRHFCKTGTRAANPAVWQEYGIRRRRRIKFENVSQFGSQLVVKRRW